MSVERVVSFAIHQKAFTIAAALVLLGFGVYAYRQVPVEAFPDPDDVHVQVITLFPGQAAEEIESLVTRPAEQQLNGTPGLTQLRSISMFGLSVVTCTFEDGTEDNFARAQVLEKMQGVNLPPGAQWQLASLSTSTGEVFRYVLEASGPAAGTPLEELRALQDWVVEPQLRQVSGVADVVAFGGGIKQYQVSVRPDLLLQHGVTMGQVCAALSNSNLNVGGGVLRSGEQQLVVRGVGLLQSLEEIGSVVVSSNAGRPVFVRDVADVRTDMAPRQGIVAYYRAATEAGAPPEDHDDIVQGIIVQRKGSNAVRVIDGVRRKIAEINRFELPKGVRLVPIYDRTDLVDETVRTVLHNLVEGAVLVLVILLVFTSSLRGALIVASTIPLSLMAAFLALHLRGMPANLLSFGAVDFGIIVDAAVVVVEAVLVKRLAQAAETPNRESFDELVRSTASHLGHALLFGSLITITALVPIFTFERVEGRIFRPMAYTIGAAIIGARVLSLTLIPVLAAIFLRRARTARPNLVVRGIQAVYAATLRWMLDRKIVPIGAAIVLLLASAQIVRHLGTEFLPKLDEGNIWLTVVQPLSVSTEHAKETERRIREILESFPEASLIYSQLGRPDDGTDPKGANSMEIAVYLRPRAQWTTRDARGRLVDKDGLIALMNERLQQLPGLELNFSQVIEDNVEEALSGVKGELAIKLFGDDLRVLQDRGESIRKVIADVPGVADLAIEQISGQPNVNITLKRDAIARYGLDAQTVLSLVETGLGGRVATSVLEGQRRFDLTVRLAESARATLDQIGSLWVDAPGGLRVPLNQLADVRIEDGASRISRDRNSRRIALRCGVRGRDMGSFVAEAQRLVQERVQLPPGYTLTWEGQFENQRRATTRLAVIVPVSLLAIFGLLFWAFQSVRYSLLIMMNVPLALIGGIVLLFLTGTNLSVSAMIGFIALAGVCVQNGMILVSQFNTQRAKGLALRDAVVSGARARVRPVLMTALMAAIGMEPAATSTGIGSEVQRPLALVILGGMTSAVLLTLVVLPCVYEWLERVWPSAAAEGHSSLIE
jgi:cobalt-zinc-cadmium resistance protein CzcA